MNKKFRAFVIAVVLTVLIPSNALAASIPAVKTFGGPEVVAKPDGVEIQYFKEYTGKVFYDLPEIIKTTEQGNGVKTLKYEFNLISNEDLAGVEHKILDTGAYVKITNIVRESEFNGERILYAKAPVTVTFEGDGYAQEKEIQEFTKSRVDNGNVLYVTTYDYRTSKTYYKEVYDLIDYGLTSKTLEKPGMYHILFGPILGDVVTAYIYVADENEDLTYIAPKAETATPSSAKVEVDGKKYNVPAYSINGENFMRVRDIAYMLNGTSKQFDVIYNKWQDSVLLRTSDYVETPEKENAYKAVGGELKALPSGSKTANPSKQKLTLDGIQINPLAYNIDGNNFIRLKDIGKIIDFNITWDITTGTVKIDTNSEYKGIDNTQVSSFIKADNTERLSGDDRYQTAVAISKKGWVQSDNVILATGDNFPDALVGSSFAYLKDAPILITTPNKLNADTANEMARLGVKTVYILGNEASVSRDIENELKAKYNVVRISGAGLFDTAVKVGEEIRKIKSFDTVALATQNDFPDALAIAPFSAKNTMPILFSGKDALRVDTKKALEEWGIRNVVISGGPAVVSSAVEQELTNMGINVIRLSGDNRYETALAIAKHFESNGQYSGISVATGENYPDALTGAVLAAKNNVPLLLVGQDSVHDAVLSYLNNHTLNTSYVFGGTTVVSKRVLGK